VSSEIIQVDESGESSVQGNENDEICRVGKLYSECKKLTWNQSSALTILLLFFRAVLENVHLDVGSSCETISQEQRNDEISRDKICRWVKPFTV